MWQNLISDIAVEFTAVDVGYQARAGCIIRTHGRKVWAVEEPEVLHTYSRATTTGELEIGDLGAEAARLMAVRAERWHLDAAWWQRREATRLARLARHNAKRRRDRAQLRAQKRMVCFECAHCGREASRSHKGPAPKYCSKTCRGEAYMRRHPESVRHRNEITRARELAKRHQARDARAQGVSCKQCGEALVVAYKGPMPKFCSQLCRSRFRGPRKAKRLATREGYQP